MNNIYQLLYISEQSAHFMETDLEEVLDKSHKNNQSKGLTGILIKNGPFFIQLLEGQEEVVNKLFQKISGDPRHIRVKTLMTHTDSKRIFPNWSMGFVDGSKEKIKMNELIPIIHQDFLAQTDGKSRILSILKKFNQKS